MNYVLTGPTDDGTVPPADRARACVYPMLPNGATLGTVCEYEKDHWTWIIITALDEKPGREYDRLEFDTDEPLVRFLILDKLPDDVWQRFEGAIGCYQHVSLAREYSDHDGAGFFIPRSSFLEKFKPLGPLHPDFDGGDDGA